MKDKYLIINLLVISIFIVFLIWGLSGDSKAFQPQAVSTETKSVDEYSSRDISPEEYIYPNKEWWYKETESITSFWKQHKNIYDLFGSLGNVDRGWSMNAFVNSELGEGVLNLMLHWLRYPDEMGQEVLHFWTENGIKKEMHDTDDPENKWASYMPLCAYKAENDGRRYPLVLCFRGGNDPIYSAEGFGFVMLGGKEEYITVIPYNRSPDAIQKLMDDITDEYPVDASRIYLTGNGNGGLQTIYNALAYPKKFAAIGPFGLRPMIRNFQGELPSPQVPAQVEALKSIKMPIMVVAGQYESPGHYPLSISSRRDPQVKLDDFNTWLEINSIVADPLTLGVSEGLVINSDEWIERQTGIDFPVTWIEKRDGTNYCFGEFYDSEGINLMRIAVVENCNHWHGTSYPEMSNLKNIDVAFLPMNKPYTMSPEQVAEAARRIRPKILYPYHYSDTNPEELVKLLENEKNIEVRIREMQ